MPVLTNRLVSEIMRQRLGIKDASQSARILTQIPEALKATGRKIAADPSTRDLMLTDRTVAKIALTSGAKVDLSTLYSTYFALREFLELGQMYFLGSSPFTTGAVDASANTVAVTNLVLHAGDRVQFTTTGTLPGGFSLSTDYYVNTFDAATGLATFSPTPALSSVIDVSSAGSGTHTVVVQETAGHPMQKISGGSRTAPFDRYLDVYFTYYYIEGMSLYVKPAGAQGQVAFAVPTYPHNLAALPISEEAQLIFLDTLQQLLTGQPDRRDNIAL